MTAFLSAWVDQAVRSEILAGGLALGILGTALALLRPVLSGLWGVLSRRFSASVTLDSRSDAYAALHAWTEAQGVLTNCRRLRVTGLRRGDRNLLAPAPGLHLFWHGGRPCLLRRDLDRRATSGGRGGGPVETVTLTLPFGRVGTLCRWLEEGAGHLHRRDRIGPEVFILRGDWWQSLGQVRGRGLETVVAEDDRLHRLAADLRRFLDAQAWYAQRGVPWRRGYLLYGPPGSGKSSAIRALASDMGLDIASLDLSRPGLTDDDLREAMATAPPRALLVIEDVDAAFRGRALGGAAAGGTAAGGAAAGVTFSGLLNAIDGVAAQEGRALVMTTNHRDRLDPALVRPGRADVHVELGAVVADAAALMFLRFFPGEAALAARFRQALGEARVVPAAVQGWLLAQADDPVAASSADGLATPEPQQRTEAVCAGT